MRRVYQRASRLAVLAALAAACGEPPPPARLEPRPPPDAAALHLASRAYELVDAGARPPRLLADERSLDGSRAVAVALDGGAIAVLGPARGESRAVSAFPGDPRALLEVAAPGEPAPRLAVGAAGGAPRPLPSAVAGERFAGWLRGGAAFAVAGPSPEGGESLWEVDARGLARRELERVEPGFAIAAVDGEARLLALVRRVGEEADELVLRDRRLGESRLLLPSDADGRFRPHLFLPGGDLLLSADDGSELPRLERLEPATGRRRPFARPGCPVESARLDAAGGVAVELDCAGRREAYRVGLDGVPAPLPAAPSGVRSLRFLLGDEATPTALGWGGPRWPPDLATVDARGLALPLTAGLAPRLGPGGGAAVEPAAVPSGGVALPCELRRPTGAIAAGLAWLEDPGRPARFDEYRPLPSALASLGLAVLSCRGRGSDGFGRTLRRAADGDRTGAALGDLRAVLAALRARLPRETPLAVAGEGGWWGAAALALAAASGAEASLAVALFPDPDPLAPLAALAALAARATADGERADPLPDGGPWGDTRRPGLAELAAAWRFPVDGARLPSLVLLDDADPASGELAARIEAAAAAGAPVTALRGPRSRFGGEPTGELARALVAALGGASASRPREAPAVRPAR